MPTVDLNLWLEGLKLFIFSIVEALTEWLPVSSTGHLLLLEHFWPLKLRPEFVSLYTVLIQLAAIMAVVCLYFSTLWPFARPSRLPLEERVGSLPIAKSKLLLWCKIFVASLPAAVVGLLFDDWIEAHFYRPEVVVLFLALVALLFLLVEHFLQGKSPRVQKLEQLSFQTAFLIGLAQMLAAVFPGSSRSGTTILMALLLSCSRPLAAEFTFLLGIPAMAGASLLKLLKLGVSLTAVEWGLMLASCLLVFCLSLFVIRRLLSYLKSNSFRPFAYYRLALAALVFALLVLPPFFA